MPFDLALIYCYAPCEVKMSARKLKSIDEYLPKKPSERVLIQAMVPKELHAKIRDMIKRDDLTWNDLVCALLRRHADEKSE